MYYSFPYASQPLTHRLRRRSFRLGPATNISNRIAQYCGRVFHFANFAWKQPLSNGGLCQKGKEGKGREGKGKDRKGKERTGKDRKRKDRKGQETKGQETKGQERTHAWKQPLSNGGLCNFSCLGGVGTRLKLLKHEMQRIFPSLPFPLSEEN